ncbi:carbohydrate ABC transporter permease [Streptomyces sp. WMMB 322]|uniref:carbohydrate ABC transporter permease n=1 Tax=Streptomyces sp. WMMB 322 TaxID=1286821 RepID=UPI000823D049|nr:sugar ABC transporter permease [Streptomyces sp. WMMB 322]SCK45518.1 carbohydrate ABC transporter membrane protein 1, CUT1 family (TC 3.A.1.1.-) [Streptomyces sp. WMMB 322]
MPTTVTERPAPPPARRRPGLPGVPGRSRSRTTRGREGLWGWFFVSPMVVGLGLFMALPILMAAWVSLLNWNGQSNPFTPDADFVGLDNYRSLLAEDGLARSLLATSLRNNAYYVLLTVPLQTALSLALAIIVNQRMLRGRGMLRTTFYFPSVTSSIAVCTVFLFLFQGSGAVNQMLGWIGLKGPNWFQDSRGVLWVLMDKLGIIDGSRPGGFLAEHRMMGLPFSEWLAGPSVAMCTLILLAVWTTSGTFMLIFLAALQNIPRELEEAAALDGAARRHVLRHVLLPALRPVLFLVTTLGLIATWQVFDQVYVLGQGEPANTTLTPAFLSYSYGFDNAEFGQGAAISFILLGIVLLMTGVQRFLLRERGGGREARRIAASAVKQPDAGEGKEAPGAHR